ncbi:substrate-binding domain-containing protein [Novosphingobium terrae]|uniref:substrate-binding domain-containing protein n=1 Tax=Novosphingobium terrae TaxID=2726189 RepID=UPI0019802F79|nr:substrate-binding domain-containing protein [Novosphingobium terrae]
MASRATLLSTALAMVLVGKPVRAETVEVFAAGSLRGAMAEIGQRAATMGIQIKPVFGGSGTLRERIEKGEKPDLLLSADMGSPLALAAQGRTFVPPVAFARNRLCLVARHELKLKGLSAPRLVDGLLAKGVRIRTSRPVADPSGDYAMAMFDLMDKAHPGAAKALRDRAAQSWDLPLPALTAGQNATTALFAAKSIDVAVTYCSATSDLTKGVQDLDTVPVPAAFDPQPVFGLALLSDKAAAARLGLLLLSGAGQDALATAGLLKISDSHARQARPD